MKVSPETSPEKEGMDRADTARKKLARQSQSQLTSEHSEQFLKPEPRLFSSPSEKAENSEIKLELASPAISNPSNLAIGTLSEVEGESMQTGKEETTLQTKMAMIEIQTDPYEHENPDKLKQETSEP